MARVIDTKTNVKIGFSIVNHYTDDTSLVTNLYENDIVENFSYVENHEVYTVSGRISSISVSSVNRTNKPISDLISNQLIIDSVTIDTSEQYESSSVKVPAREILEYNSEGTETKRVEIIPIISVDVTTKLSDGTTTHIELNEDDIIADVILLTKNGDKLVDLDIDHFVYTINNKTMEINVTGIVLKNDMKNVLDIMAIKCCGKESIILGDGDSIQEALDNIDKSGTENAIILLSTTSNEKLSLKGKISIKGSYSNIPANKGNRRSDTVDKDETVLTNVISCEKDSEVTLQGLTFTNNTRIVVNSAKSILLKNCKFTSINPSDIESPNIVVTSGTGVDTKVMIEGCYFGNNNRVEGKTIYNGIDFNTPLAKGSYIKDCYFDKNALSHNAINIYNIAEGALINISNNVFEYSANAIRIGTQGDAKGIIKLDNNTYLDTDPNEKYAGLVIIQPYLKKTTSMANLTLIINNTKKAEGQLYYGYFGENDTKMNSTLWCKVYVDGKREVITVGDDVEDPSEPIIPSIPEATD